MNAHLSEQRKHESSFTKSTTTQRIPARQSRSLTVPYFRDSRQCRAAWRKSGVASTIAKKLRAHVSNRHEKALENRLKPHAPCPGPEWATLSGPRRPGARQRANPWRKTLSGFLGDLMRHVQAHRWPEPLPRQLRRRDGEKIETVEADSGTSGCLEDSESRHERCRCAPQIGPWPALNVSGARSRHATRERQLFRWYHPALPRCPMSKRTVQCGPRCAWHRAPRAPSRWVRALPGWQQ